MFGLAAATVGSHAGSDRMGHMGQLGGPAMDVFSNKHSRNRAIDDVSGHGIRGVHNVMIREIFSMAARLLAVHEVHLCLLLMQALDKNIGSTRVDSCSHEDFHSLLQDFVQAEKAKGDERSVVKDLGKRKRDESVPPLESDDRLRHIWKGGTPHGLALKARGSIDRTAGTKEEKKDTHHRRKEAGSEEARTHPKGEKCRKKAAAPQDSSPPPRDKPLRHAHPKTSLPASLSQKTALAAEAAEKDFGSSHSSHSLDFLSASSTKEVKLPPNSTQQAGTSGSEEVRSRHSMDDSREEVQYQHISESSRNTARSPSPTPEDVVVPVSPKTLQAIPPEEDHLQYLPAEEVQEQERQKSNQLETPQSRPMSNRSSRDSSRVRNQSSLRRSRECDAFSARDSMKSVSSRATDMDRAVGREAKAISCDNAFMPPPDRREIEIMKRLSGRVSGRLSGYSNIDQCGPTDVGRHASIKSEKSVQENVQARESTPSPPGSPKQASRNSTGSMESVESSRDQLVALRATPGGRASQESIQEEEEDDMPVRAATDGNLDTNRKLSRISFAQEPQFRAIGSGPVEGPLERMSRGKIKEALNGLLGGGSASSGIRSEREVRRQSKRTRSTSVLDERLEDSSPSSLPHSANASRRQSLSKKAHSRRQSMMNQQRASPQPTLSARGSAMSPQWPPVGLPPHTQSVPLMPLDVRSSQFQERRQRRRSTRDSSMTGDSETFKHMRSAPIADRSLGSDRSSSGLQDIMDLDMAHFSIPGRLMGEEDFEDLPDDAYSDYSSDGEGDMDSFEEDEYYESSESSFSDAGEEDKQLKTWLSGEAKRKSRASRLDAKWKLLRDGGTVAFEDVLEEDTFVLSEPSNRFIMHPDWAIRVCWDICVLSFILFDSYAQSLTLGFDVQLPDAYPWITSGFFITDIIMSLLTGYSMDGVLVMRHNMIIKNYLFTPSRCVIDVLASLPWDAIHDPRSEDSHFTEALAFNMLVLFFRFMRLLRLLKLRDTIARFEERFTSRGAVLGFVLGKTMVSFMLLCHWCACCWAFIGTPMKTGFTDLGPPYDIYVECERGGPCEAGIEGSPWMRRYAIETLEFKHQYILALHFAAAVITGNDLSMQPGWWLERLFVSVMMICSFFVCTWMVSQIIVVMQKLRRLQIDFTDQLQMVKDFMTKRNIPTGLQLKVRRYLEYQFENRKARNDNPEFLHHLSPWLQLELRECLHKGVLTRHPFFQQLPDKVLKHICGMASSVYYAPNDVVVQRGQRASSMCFIVRGKLCVLGVPDDNGQGNTHKILMQPSWIGDMCLFMDMKRTKTVVSVTHSELLVVQKTSIMLLVNEFPKILISYRHFKRKIEGGELMACGMVCECCQQWGHSTGDCPELQEVERPLSSPDLNGARHSRMGGASIHLDAVMSQNTAKLLANPGAGHSHQASWMEGVSSRAAGLNSARHSSMSSISSRAWSRSASRKSERFVNRISSGRESAREMIKTFSNKTMQVLKVPSLKSQNASQEDGHSAKEAPGVVKTLSYKLESYQSHRDSHASTASAESASE